ncbi:MAG: protein arginine kinase [Clostridiales bacterium]|jgi:protein arginine kinase|nr:protein arginine kinase [Clostridiales bacterium]
MNKWYEKTGEQGDVIVSTRIRLARNLMNDPFPCKLQKDGMLKVDKAVKDAVIHGNSAISNQFEYIDMGALSQTEAVSLVERHLVSPEFVSEREGRGLLLMNDESVSIMINEEDHLRIQVMQQGMALEEAYRMADRLDTLLDERLKFAFDDRLGYLTQCPTNLGTGMRASLMLHLPALQDSGAMDRIAGNLSKLGLTIRGIYGEGTQPKGALYQLSNQVTLGLSEEAAISNLRDIALQLVSQERAARESISRHLETQDAIGRSLGILLNARLLNNDEFMKLISNVRLGISMGIIDNISYDQISALMIEAQPATLMKNVGKTMTPPERDKRRAELVKERLS